MKNINNWLDYNSDNNINYLYLYLIFIGIDFINLFFSLFINKKYFFYLLIVNFLSLFLIIINKRIKKYYIVVISLFLNPFLRVLFPTSIFVFYRENGFNPYWYLAIIIIHLFSLFLPLLLRKNCKKLLNFLGSNFIFLIGLIVVILIPNKFAVQLANDVLRVILNQRIVISFIIIDLFLNLALFSAINLKLIEYNEGKNGTN